MAGRETPALVILGATGFLGSALIDAAPAGLRVKAVARRVSPELRAARPGVEWIEADLLAPDSLQSVLSPADIVCNLAYMMDDGAANTQLIRNVIEACLQARVARLVHCSTAVVAGEAPVAEVLESTACRPVTAYQRTKLHLEEQVRAAVPRGLDAVILRPTAIVGPGGQNLLKLARSLLKGNPLASYLRASLFGRRRMHLVPVRDVAAAILHVISLQGPLRGDVYHVSADDDPDNNFAVVELILAQALHLRARRLPLLPVPPVVLSFFLRLTGRGAADVNRVYTPRKLRATGFKPSSSVAGAVREMAASLL